MSSLKQSKLAANYMRSTSFVGAITTVADAPGIKYDDIVDY